MCSSLWGNLNFLYALTGKPQFSVFYKKKASLIFCCSVYFEGIFYFENLNFLYTLIGKPSSLLNIMSKPLLTLSSLCFETSLYGIAKSGAGGL